MQTRETTPPGQTEPVTGVELRAFLRAAFGTYTVAGIVALALVGAALGGLTHGSLGAAVGALIGAASAAVFGVQITLIWTKRHETTPWHVVAGVAAVLALMLMGDVTGFLLFMREEGVPARSIGWITSTVNRQAVMDNAAQLAYFDAAISEVRSSRWIVWAFIAIDSIVFVWAYGIVGVRLIESRRQVVQESTVPNAKRFLRWAMWLLVMVLVIDWVENLAIGVLVEDSLATVAEPARSAEAAGGPAPTDIPPSAVTSVFVWVTTVMFSAKWVAVGLVFVLYFAERFSSRGHNASAGRPVAWFTRNSVDLLEAGRRVRPLLVTLVVLAVLLFQPLQVDDLMLSLGDDGSKLAYAAIASLWMGITMWSWTRYLLRNRRDANLLDPGDHWLIGLGAALIAAGTVVMAAFDWHWIVLFPGAALVIIGSGGYVVGRAVDASERSESARSSQVDLPGDVLVALQVDADDADDADDPPARPHRTRQHPGHEEYRWVLIGGVGLAVSGLGGVLAGVNGWDRLAIVLLVLGGFLVVGAALGVAKRAVALKRRTGRTESRDKRPASTAQDPTDFLPAFVGATSVAIVGTSMLSAAAAEALFAGGSSGALWVTLVGVGLVVLSGSVLGFKRLQVFGNPGPTGEALVSSQAMSEVSLGVSLIAALGFAIWVWVEPVRGARHVGALALLLLLLSAVGAGSGQLIRWIDRMKAPRLFRQFAIDRFPVFALIGLWLIVGQVFLDRSNHDVTEPVQLAEATAEPAECTGPVPPRPSVEQAWNAWLATNGIEPGTEEPRTQYPLIIVASSGGGIRAAWWSAAVMGELIPEPGPVCPDMRPDGYDGRQIFAGSGISGGSLGLAAHQAAAVSGIIRDGSGEPSSAWVEKRLGVDHLSPPLAWFAYVEVPQSLLGFPTTSDRAAIMEQSWEQPWGDDDGLRRGVVETWQRYPQLPILALNGVSVDDGCRVLVTVLELNGDVSSCDQSEIARMDGQDAPLGTLPQTYGFGSFMCEGTDMRLSTAALLSARFPLISPSGRLETGRTIDQGECSSESVIEVVDGGYRDSNGAETAIDLWREVQPFVNDFNAEPTSTVCIVPVFVQILDDFRLPAPPSEPSFRAPLLGPVEAILAAWGTLSNTGDRSIAAEEAFGERRYEIQPRDVPPGAHPALGWSLSETTRNKMTEALAQSSPSSGLDEFRVAVNDLVGMPCS